MKVSPTPTAGFFSFSPMRCILYALLCCLPVCAFAAGTYPQTIREAGDRTVSVGKAYQRIISLYPAHTENLCSMGAARQLVGISRTDSFPEKIVELPRFSARDDAEKFIAHHPDLVLVRPMIERAYPELLKKLKKSGITVISLQPGSAEQMFDYWLALGILSGHQQQAQAMVAEFTQKSDLYRQKLEQRPLNTRPMVYFSAIHKKMKTFAEGSMALFVLELAGGRNVAGDATRVRSTNIAYFGKEKLLSRGEQIDIFLSQHGRMNPASREIIASEPGFKAIRAVREQKIYLVEEAIVSRPTMRLLQGIATLENILYPVADGNQKEKR
ncbi:MAG: peptide ABC transporter substrate-binding protein [Deltaproteobacteria bacterium]|nr:MAG: peptide ABC transporter substrate-binding protein [Deltaproteobacteria bacterium]